MYQETSGAAAPPSASNVISMVQLQTLQQRREIIAEQYQNTIAERGRIGQERLNAQARGDMGMVKEYDATIARLGTRLQNLERSLRAADAQIDAAVQSPIALEGEPVSATDPVTAISLVPPTGSQVDGMLRAQANEYQRAMAIEVERLSEGQRFINNLMATRRPEREALPSLPGTTPNDGTRITPH